MSTVLNEVKQAEFIIKNRELGNKPSSTLFILAKYYRQKQELNKEQTFQKLDEFMQKNYKNYNSAKWEDIMEDISKKATKYPMREIDNISITQYELDMIRTLKNIKYEKLLFTMLCYAKLHNMNSENNNGWVNTSIQELYRIARVSVKYKKDKFLILNDLEQTGLIAFSKKNDNLNLQVTFVDMDGASILSVADFRELGYEYLNYIGEENFIRCSKCGKLTKRTGKRNKYCFKCKKEKQLEWDLSYKRKKRKEFV